jgi:hypothetical protein
LKAGRHCVLFFVARRVQKSTNEVRASKNRTTQSTNEVRASTNDFL